MSVLDNVIPFLAGLVVASWKAQEKTRDLQGRTVCLRAVNQMTNQFYDIAERLLSDPAMPDALKNAIYDMTIAVTDKDAGRKSVDVILESLASSKANSLSGGDSLESGLAALRKDRGDLYDDFHTAIRTAIMAIILSYGPDHSKSGDDRRGSTLSSSLSIGFNAVIASISSSACSRLEMTPPN